MKKEDENSVTKHNLKAVQDLKKTSVWCVPSNEGGKQYFLLQIDEVQKLQEGVLCL